LRSHEVVGITGTLDSGVHTLAGVLAGAEQAAGGTVTVRNENLRLGKPQPLRCARAGVVYVPQDRVGQGVAAEATVGENLTLPRVGREGLLRYLRPGWQRAEFDRVVAELDVKPPRADLPISKLSGGNQQKVLFGKWLMQEPAVLVLHEPLQAVDVGARRDLMRAMRAAASRGTAVLICSEEADELAAVCDRVLVLSDGRVGAELTQPFTSDDVLTAIYGDDNEETTT
jgi:ribose transport system ATP-binding protein